MIKKKIELHKITNKERIFRFIESCKGKVATYTQIQKFIYEYNNPGETFHGNNNRGYWSTNLSPYGGFLFDNAGYGKLVRRLRNGKYIFSVERPYMYKKTYKFREDLKTKISKLDLGFSIGNKVEVIVENGGIYGASYKKGETVLIKEINGYNLRDNNYDIIVYSENKNCIQTMRSSEVQKIDNIETPIKIGELVTITANSNYHKFKIGEIVRVTNNQDWLNDGYRCEHLDSSDWWYVKKTDMKLHILEDIGVKPSLKIEVGDILVGNHADRYRHTNKGVQVEVMCVDSKFRIIVKIISKDHKLKGATYDVDPEYFDIYLKSKEIIKSKTEIKKPKVMPTKQVTLKENEFIVDASFIKLAHKAACTEWKAKLEDKFPTAFPKEPTYKIGQRFVDISSDKQYLLAKVERGNKVNMLSLSNGQNFSNPYEVQNVEAITQEELFKLADQDFRLVK